jgi:hypothetical protein
MPLSNYDKTLVKAMFCDDYNVNIVLKVVSYTT